MTYLGQRCWTDVPDQRYLSPTTRADRDRPRTLGSAQSIDRLLAVYEVVDANGRSDVARRLGFPIFKRRAGGIGDAINGVEETRYCSGIDQCRWAKGSEQRSARRVRGASIIAEHRLGERHELLAMDNAAVSGARHHDREIEGLARVFGARTEQLHMADGSIGTLIEGRHPSRNELDLGVGYGAILVGEVAHGGTW